MMRILAAGVAVVALWAVSASAQQPSEQREAEQANLEFMLGKGFTEAAQLRMQLVQVRKELADAKAKCADRCAPPETPASK